MSNPKSFSLIAVFLTPSISPFENPTDSPFEKDWAQQGCGLISARELKEEIRLANESISREYAENQQGEKSYLLDSLEEETAKQIDAIKHQGE